MSGKNRKEPKKKYYSPIREYDSFKRPHLFFRALCAMIRRFMPPDEVEWRCAKPADGAAVVYVCNHTKIYAPAQFILYAKNSRVWLNYYFLRPGSCWKHMRTRVLHNRKPKFVLYPLAFFLTPIIVMTMRAFNPIPTYHTPREAIGLTFKKTVETLKSGMSAVIFPERTENRVNKYIWQLSRGFPRLAQAYYAETGKTTKFYPVYCAQKLHKFVVGEPIEYDPEIPMAKQKNDIAEYLENAICELGDSLPEHEPTIYG